MIVSGESDSDSVEGLLLDDDETFSCLDDDAIHSGLWQWYSPEMSNFINKLLQ